MPKEDLFTQLYQMLFFTSFIDDLTTSKLPLPSFLHACHVLCSTYPHPQALLAAPPSPLLPWNDALPELLEMAMLERRVFVGTMSDKRKIFGLCYPFSRSGDTIAILHGCRWPVQLRRIEGKEEFTVVGEVYVHGYMKGEAMGVYQNREFKIL